MLVKIVNHADLKQEGDSMFRVRCPECDQGVLFMRRSFKTLRLLNWDICPSCSMRFIFDDINELRKRERSRRLPLKKKLIC